MVKSPATTERGDYGDVYVSIIKSGRRKLDYNPLTHQDNRTTGKEETA